MMTNYAKLPTWADSEHVYVVVETPRGSRAKLEFDPKLGAFSLAKPLLAGLTYPYDWGFIPSTKGPGRRSARRSHYPRCRDVSGPRAEVQADRRARSPANIKGRKGAQRSCVRRSDRKSVV